MRFSDIRHELRLNPQHKIKVLLVLWRLSKLRQEGPIYYVFLFPIHLIYWFYSQIMLSIELPIGVSAKFPLIIWHGAGIVINPGVVIGKNVVLRNGVVIGNNGQEPGCPVVEDNVEFGANSVIVGEIKIGSKSKISPCSFINSSLPNGSKAIVQVIFK